MTVTPAPAATSVPAGRLKPRDVFAYSGQHITVLEVTPLAHGSAKHAAMVEVHGTDTFGGERWLDYGKTEEVLVVGGPSVKAAPAAAPEPVKTATQVAREAVRLGKVRTLPSSAALVLYALAAAEEEATAGFAPSIGSIATGAGLAVSTTQGHLRSLARLGLVGGSNDGGWTIARR